MGNQCNCWSQSNRSNIEVDVPQRESEQNVEASEIIEKKVTCERFLDLYNFLNEDRTISTSKSNDKSALIKKAGNAKQTLADFENLEEERGANFRLIVSPRLTKKLEESPTSSERQTPISTRKSSQNSNLPENKSRKAEPTFKTYLTLLGESGVGKTSLIYKICFNKFDLYHIPTIKAEQVMYETKHEGANYQVNLIDTCGLSEYKSNIDELILNVDFLVYIVDLTNSRSFSYVKMLLEESRLKSNGKANSDCIQRIILGNKVDLAARNKELKESVREYAHSAHIPYFDVSAKTNFNLVKLMKHCLEVFYNRTYS